ncbi:MAG TPA: hypothetical protein VF029_03445 [Actinomycetota bacterium]
MEAKREDVRCPICGEGVLINVAYEDRFMEKRRLRQRPEAREIRRFSCGHEWTGSPLASADTDRLTVEERVAEDLVEPVGREEEDRRER